MKKSTTTFKYSATGIMQKSNTDSFFSTFHYTSNFAKSVLTETPKLEGKEVTVLQILFCDNGYFLAELIYTDKF